MNDLRLAINSSSNSFDRIELISVKGVTLVQKTFVNDIARSELSIRKQMLFNELNSFSCKVFSPNISFYKSFKNRFMVNMPYIEGISAENFSIYGTRKIADVISETLSELIMFELSKSVDTEIAVSIFINKLNSIYLLTKDDTVKSYVMKLISMLESKIESITLPLGPCHGDLTLSNMIYTSTEGLALIDFLFTYLESPLQDISKIKQDYDYGWSFRKTTPPLNLKSKIFTQSHYPEIINKVKKLYPFEDFLVTAMTLLRIAPYVSDDETAVWLKNTLNKFFRENINFL